MGSGGEAHPELAGPLGERIARGGWHLLTGAGGGVMAEVARAFCNVPGREGLSIGVVRCLEPPTLDPRTGRRDYRPNPPNQWVELPIYTHLHRSSQHPESRNHLNVLTADALVALPGGPGTLSEVHLRLQYGRPLLLHLGAAGTIAGRTAADLLAEAEDPERIEVAASIDEASRWLEQSLG